MKNPYLRIYFLASIFLSVVLLGSGCSKSASVTPIQVFIPIVTTQNVFINLTTTSVQSGGAITYTGGGQITANGVCYSTTNSTPTITDSKTSDSVSTTLTASTTNAVNFKSYLSNLMPNTLYYLRAYATNSAGTGYGAVIQLRTTTTLTVITSTVSTFAGNGTAGNVNATGGNAQFNNPQGITTDAQGNLYVSDSFNSTIRKITLAGVVTTIAGNGAIGYTDGAAVTAQFYSPQGIVIDGQGNIYVADLGNNVIRKITAAGVVSTFAGNGTAGYVDGAANVAQFKGPHGLAIDGQGNIYVADRGNNLIRKITSAGVVSTLAGKPTGGYADATGTSALFSNPNGVAVDGSGNVYVADQGNSAIRKITAAGVVTTLVGGVGQPLLVNFPTGLALDAQANIYITDEGGRILESTTSNALYNLAGKLNSVGFNDGSGSSALFNNPQALTVTSNGNIYVADQNNSAIRKITIP
jgi:sugar lactone lactonase YvrE